MVGGSVPWPGIKRSTQGALAEVDLCGPDLEVVIVMTSSPNPNAGRRNHGRELDDLTECNLALAIRRVLAEAA